MIKAWATRTTSEIGKPLWKNSYSDQSKFVQKIYKVVKESPDEQKILRMSNFSSHKNDCFKDCERRRKERRLPIQTEN